MEFFFVLSSTALSASYRRDAAFLVFFPYWSVSRHGFRKQGITPLSVFLVTRIASDRGCRCQSLSASAFYFLGPR